MWSLGAAAPITFASSFSRSGSNGSRWSAGWSQGQAEITGLDADAVELLVVLDQPPPSRHRFDVVLALPRPKCCAAFSYRCRVRCRSPSDQQCSGERVIGKHHWYVNPCRRCVAGGHGRARDTIAPQVHCHQRFRPFVEDELTSRCAGRPCWITDQGAPLALADVLTAMLW